MDLFQFCTLVGTLDTLMPWLRDNNKSCMTCTLDMYYVRVRDVVDGYRFECSNRRCRKKLSIRHNTFFEKSKLSLKTIVTFIYLWVKQVNRQFAHSVTVTLSQEKSLG